MYIEDTENSVASTRIDRRCVVIEFIDVFGEVFVFLQYERWNPLLSCYRVQHIFL